MPFSLRKGMLFSDNGMLFPDTGMLFPNTGMLFPDNDGLSFGCEMQKVGKWT